jgi:hypothetical protein
LKKRKKNENMTCPKTKALNHLLVHLKQHHQEKANTVPATGSLTRRPKPVGKTMFMNK